MRFSKKVNHSITPRQFEAAMAHYAQNVKRTADIEALIADEINLLQEKHKHELLQLAEQKAYLQQQLETYCREQKSTLFNIRRSMQTAHGSIGFRTAKPKLMPLNDTSWPQILQNLKAQLPQYVRTKEEPAKDALLADKDKEQVASRLAHIGLQVVQDELFFIDICTAPKTKMLGALQNKKATL
jgi:phage host-nuclease inhibitor protein Gam